MGIRSFYDVFLVLERKYINFFLIVFEQLLGLIKRRNRVRAFKTT